LQAHRRKPQKQRKAMLPAARQHDDGMDQDIHARFEMKEMLGEGTYGQVVLARDKLTNQHRAIKKIKLEFAQEGVPATALREISLLKNCDHPNVIRLYEVLSSSSLLFLVFEVLDMDLRKYLKTYLAFPEAELKRAAHQCVAGLAYVHLNRIVHRDLKPQNILVDVKTKILKLADFGLARANCVPLKVFTHEVVTLWYRAPEILLGQKRYSTPTDIWSIGAIIVEMASAQATFPGDSEIDTLFRIFQLLGTPTDAEWRGVTKLEHYKKRFPNWPNIGLAELRRTGPQLGSEGFDLVLQCLRYDPVTRPSARAMLQHPFFSSITAASSREGGTAATTSPPLPRDAPAARSESDAPAPAPAAPLPLPTFKGLRV